MNLLSYCSGGQKFTVSFTELNQSVGRPAFLLEALEEDPFLSLFQLLERLPTFLSLWPLSSSSKPAA